MKETAFIRQNKEKWEECEQLLKSDKKDPASLSNFFTQITDDLSYSRTFYRNRSIRLYLNNIARIFFSRIYVNKKKKKGAFALFWKEEYPQIVIYCKKELLLALVIFIGAAAIGVFSSMHDPGFARHILGEQYVEMTKANIKSGDPMAVYKSSNQVDMFLGITLNNLMVSFRTYIMGILMGLGSVASLIYNGIMLGVFQYFFVQKGLFMESASVIWLHGTIEIASIIIAGGAGITLGRGLVFPGTYSRLQSFQMSSARSLKLLLGIVPFICFAAFIESFITRYSDMPLFVKVSLIAVSLMFMITYFIWYPFVKSRNGFKVRLEEVKVMPDILDVKADRLRNNAEIIKDAFYFFRLKKGLILKLCFLAAVLLKGADLFIAEQHYPYLTAPNLMVQICRDVMFYCFTAREHAVAFVHAVISATLAWILLRSLAGIRIFRSRKDIASFIQTLLLWAVFYRLSVPHDWYLFLTLAGFIPLLLLNTMIVLDHKNLVSGTVQSIRLLFSDFSQSAGLSIVSLIIAFFFLLVLSSPILYFYIHTVTSLLETSNNAIYAILYFTSCVQFYLVIAYMIIAGLLLYHALKEISEAAILKQQIEMIRLRV